MRNQHYFIAVYFLFAFVFLSCNNSNTGSTANILADTTKIEKVTDTASVSVTNTVEKNEVAITDTVKKKKSKPRQLTRCKFLPFRFFQLVLV